MEDGAELNADALIESAMAPESSPEVPSEGVIPGDAAEATDGAAAEAAAAEGGRALIHKGKELSMDDDKYRMYAQQGYDYNTKMHQARVDRKLFDQERDTFQTKMGNLQAIDDYAKANPAFEQLINREWAKVQAEGYQPDAQSDVQLLQSQVRTLMDQVTGQNQVNENRRVAELEAGPETSITDYKSEHSQMDWATKDAEGNSLEDRITHAMLDNGVKNFNIMADSFLMKEIQSRGAIASKEAAAKNIQKANKLGLGKVTQDPTAGVKSSEDIGNKTYDQLLKEGLLELGIEA
jgi:hypothetical protein